MGKLRAPYFFGSSDVLGAIEFSLLNRSYELTTSAALAISIMLAVLISSWSIWLTSSLTVQRSIMAASLAFLALTPLFVVASDWGRWVSLYFLKSWATTQFEGAMERATPRLDKVALLFPFLPIVGGTGQLSGEFFWFERFKDAITL